ncbi:hypothetical protein [Paenibacillus hamazuiensis]|uniref:hypothetical protein n=1 Tax=Paenibacillus hamazuiensis TaxID=2936508 RepID=UPI00200D30C5|nr:hypothetical protein [Paenibacillus hamazuiensis]
MERLFSRYAATIRALPADSPLAKEQLLAEPFLMHREREIEMFYTATIPLCCRPLSARSGAPQAARPASAIGPASPHSAGQNGGSGSTPPLGGRLAEKPPHYVGIPASVRRERPPAPAICRRGGADAAGSSRVGKEAELACERCWPLLFTLAETDRCIM